MYTNYHHVCMPTHDYQCHHTLYCEANQGGAQAQTMTSPVICPPTGIPFMCGAQAQTGAVPPAPYPRNDGYQGGGAQAPLTAQPGCLQSLGCPTILQACVNYQVGAQAQTMPPTLQPTCQHTGMIGCHTAVQHCTTPYGGGAQAQTGNTLLPPNCPAAYTVPPACESYNQTQGGAQAQIGATASPRCPTSPQQCPTYDPQQCPTNPQQCPTRPQQCPTYQQDCPTHQQHCPTHQQHCFTASPGCHASPRRFAYQGGTHVQGGYGYGYTGYQGGGAQAQIDTMPPTAQLTCRNTRIPNCPTSICTTYQGGGAQAQTVPTGLGCPTSTPHCGGAQAQTFTGLPDCYEPEQANVATISDNCPPTTPPICHSTTNNSGCAINPNTGAQAQTVPTGMLGCHTSTQGCGVIGGHTSIQGCGIIGGPTSTQGCGAIGGHTSIQGCGIIGGPTSTPHCGVPPTLPFACFPSIGCHNQGYGAEAQTITITFIGSCHSIQC